MCNVWVFTNLNTKEVRFAAHALDTGYVPPTGETNYSNLDDLAVEIQKRRFGLIIHVRSGFPSDPQTDTNYQIRVLSPAEMEKLRSFGVDIRPGNGISL